MKIYWIETGTVYKIKNLLKVSELINNNPLTKTQIANKLNVSNAYIGDLIASLETISPKGLKVKAQSNPKRYEKD